VLERAAVTADPGEPVLEDPTLEVGLELPLHGAGGPLTLASFGPTLGPGERRIPTHLIARHVEQKGQTEPPDERRRVP
jgi:hypothetical protein